MVHPWLNDLVVTINNVDLISHVGGSGQNFGTSIAPLILKDTAAAGTVPITGDSAPFAGMEFKPDCAQLYPPSDDCFA